MILTLILCVLYLELKDPDFESVYLKTCGKGRKGNIMRNIKKFIYLAPTLLTSSCARGLTNYGVLAEMSKFSTDSDNIDISEPLLIFAYSFGGLGVYAFGIMFDKLGKKVIMVNLLLLLFVAIIGLLS